MCLAMCVKVHTAVIPSAALFCRIYPSPPPNKIAHTTKSYLSCTPLIACSTLL